MFILNYLILTFQICFLAAPIDQKGKEYQNETSINQLKQNPEINNLDSTSKSSTNDNNIFSYIQTFFEKIISFVFSKICNTTDFIINPIKNLFIDSKTQKNEEPEIQEKKSLTNIQVSIENRTQEKPVNSVNPSSADPSNPQTNQVPLVSNSSIVQDPIATSTPISQEPIATSISISQEPVSQKHLTSLPNNSKLIEIEEKINPSDESPDQMKAEKLQSLDSHSESKRQPNYTPPKTQQPSSSSFNSTPPKSTSKFDPQKAPNSAKNPKKENQEEKIYYNFNLYRIQNKYTNTK